MHKDSLVLPNFKNWLSGAVAESERLQKIQHQALAAAEEGIRQTRTRMSTAFEKLAALGADIESALDENHRPKEKEFTRATPPVPAKPAKTKPAAKKAAAKKAAAPRKSVGRPPKRK